MGAKSKATMGARGAGVTKDGLIPAEDHRREMATSREGWAGLCAVVNRKGWSPGLEDF